MKSNVRFVAIWAALVPVLVAVCAIIGYSRWNEAETSLVTANVNALSALVLALVAYFWARSVREPAALQGTLSAFTLSTLLTLAEFDVVDLDDALTRMVVGLVGLIFVLVLTVMNRQVTYTPETVDIAIEKAKAEAVTPQVLMGAFATKMNVNVDVPPSSAAEVIRSL